jgi:hypothetical protein
MRALSVLVFLGTLLVPSLAFAQGSDLDRLIYNLANSEDFRVRKPPSRSAPPRTSAP